MQPMSTRPWDRAFRSPATLDGRRRPEIAALPAGLPSLGQLFTFMRDAELRFETLRLTIEERTTTAEDETLTIVETLLRHPADARVTRSEPARGTAGNHEIWISDGTTVRTYSGQHRLGSSRPVRRVVEGLDGPDLPGSSAVYAPLTRLPMDSLPEAFVHPAGFCQNVLATGRCRVAGTTEVAGREAIVIESDDPRTSEVWADQSGHRLEVSVDRETGVIVRLVESMDGVVTRDAVAVNLEPDVTLPPTAFDFTIPTGARTIF